MTDAADALDEIGRGDYRVVVVDHGMPGIQGVELLSVLRDAMPLGARLILCSGLLTDELRRQAEEFGVDTILEKPVRLERLVEAVTALRPPC